MNTTHAKLTKADLDAQIEFKSDRQAHLHAQCIAELHAKEIARMIKASEKSKRRNVFADSDFANWAMGIALAAALLALVVLIPGGPT